MGSMCAGMTVFHVDGSPNPLLNRSGLSGPPANPDMSSASDPGCGPPTKTPPGCSMQLAAFAAAAAAAAAAMDLFCCPRAFSWWRYAQLGRVVL
jgi:hypothetical protein